MGLSWVVTDISIANAAEAIRATYSVTAQISAIARISLRLMEALDFVAASISPEDIAKAITADAAACAAASAFGIAAATTTETAEHVKGSYGH